MVMVILTIIMTTKMVTRMIMNKGNDGYCTGPAIWSLKPDLSRTSTSAAENILWHWNSLQSVAVNGCKFHLIRVLEFDCIEACSKIWKKIFHLLTIGCLPKCPCTVYLKISLVDWPNQFGQVTTRWQACCPEPPDARVTHGDGDSGDPQVQSCVHHLLPPPWLARINRTPDTG